MTTPTLMVSGVNDKQVNPDRVRDFYADIGSPKKVFIDLACSSHNAMWEKNHLLLFQSLAGMAGERAPSTARHRRC